MRQLAPEGSMKRVTSPWLETDQPGERLQITSVWQEHHLFDHWQVTGSTRHWRERHETWTLCLLASQPVRCDWNHDGRSKSTPGGGLLLLDPGSSHVTTRVTAGPEGASFSLIKVDPRVVQEAAHQRGLKGRARVRRGFEHDAMLRASLRELGQAIQEGSSAVIELWLEEALTHLLELCEEPFPGASRFKVPDWRLRRLREYLDHEHEDMLSLTELARQEGMSPFHLTRICKEAFGASPTQLAEMIRFSAAKRRLEEGMPAAAVARDLGYTRHYFHRRFCKLYGVPPGQWPKTLVPPSE